MLVMTGASTSAARFTNHVGTGSRGQCLHAALRISLSTSLTVTCWNDDRVDSTVVKFLVDGFRGYGVLTPQNCHFPLTCCVALTTVYAQTTRACLKQNMDSMYETHKFITCSLDSCLYQHTCFADRQTKLTENTADNRGNLQ